MSAALMSLGMFVFSIPTLAYDQLQRRTDYRHARTGRVGARDATQFLGPGEETVSLSGTVYAEIADGENLIDQLRAMAAEGEVWPLLSATGRVFGSYVITNIDERQQHFFPDGTPRAVDFGLDLLRVDDSSQSGA